MFIAKVLCCVVLVKTLIWAEWDDPFPRLVHNHSHAVPPGLVLACLTTVLCWAGNGSWLSV